MSPPEAPKWAREIIIEYINMSCYNVNTKNKGLPYCKRFTLVNSYLKIEATLLWRVAVASLLYDDNRTEDDESNIEDIVNQFNYSA